MAGGWFQWGISVVLLYSLKWLKILWIMPLSAKSKIADMINALLCFGLVLFDFVHLFGYFCLVWLFFFFFFFIISTELSRQNGNSGKSLLYSVVLHLPTKLYSPFPPKPFFGCQIWQPNEAMHVKRAGILRRPSCLGCFPECIKEAV